MVKELSKNKIFKVDSTIEKFETDSDTNSIIIEGYASTGAVDRASDIILPSAWNKGGLDNYASNPVLLDRLRPGSHGLADPLKRRVRRIEGGHAHGEG